MPLSSMPITFPTNTFDGEEICLSLTLITDGIIEGDEYFTVTLAQLTTGLSLNLENDSAVITLTDSDGM